MRMSKAVLLLCPLLLALQGCCCTKDGGGTPTVPQGLCAFHREEPFKTWGGTSGAGLVISTADFGTSGGVLIKIQIEDLTTVPNNQATITAWSGNGNVPTSAPPVPPGASSVYSSGGDVTLRHFTTHLDRTYDPTVDRYWLIVHVDHNEGGGVRSSRWLWWEWVPSATANPDTPHDFNQY
jgi:hypothetical protein